MVVGLFISSFAFVCAGFVQLKIDVSQCICKLPNILRRKANKFFYVLLNKEADRTLLT